MIQNNYGVKKYWPIKGTPVKCIYRRRTATKNVIYVPVQLLLEQTRNTVVATEYVKRIAHNIHAQTPDVYVIQGGLELNANPRVHLYFSYFSIVRFKYNFN